MLNNSGLMDLPIRLSSYLCAERWERQSCCSGMISKNSDVKRIAVFLISLKWMKVSTRIQTVCHCQTLHQLQLQWIFYHSCGCWLLRWSSLIRCNDINHSGINQRSDNKHYRNEHFYSWKIVNKVLELILIVLNVGTWALEESIISVL